MNKKMNIIFFVFLLTFASFVLADATYYEEDHSAVDSIGSSSFSVVKLRYESYPVSPGEYFTIWVQAEKTSSEARDIKFELVENYPFFLDSNEDAVRDFQNVRSENVVLEYQVRVDESAVNGVNTLQIKQDIGFGSVIIHEFDISVSDVQTSFDAVVQETVMGETSIAIANIGQNDANAAIVRIPKQEGVTIKGNNGQMIGNLEQGDYTVVAFSFEGTGAIELQIDYTDSIGVRRSESVVVYRGSDSGDSAAVVPGSKRGASATPVESDSDITTWMIWAFVLAVVGFVGYKYHKNKKLLKTKGGSSSVPGWMKKKGAK